jgi:hypothetical protein
VTEMTGIGSSRLTMASGSESAMMFKLADAVEVFTNGCYDVSTLTLVTPMS